MSYDKNEISIKVIGFSGKKKDWITWEEKFLSKAKRRGYKDLLLGRTEIPKSTAVLIAVVDDDASDEANLIRTEEMALLVKIRELNEQGYSDLILSMDTKENAGKVAFNLVRSSKNEDYEDGNIATAFKSLQRKYSPKTAPTLAKYHKLFYSAKLKKKADPDVFITYLEDLRLNMAEMKSKMTDDQFLLHLLNSLTKDYDPEVKDLEKRIGSDDNPLDIEEVREDLNLRYERLGKPDDDSGSEDEEHALYVGGQFKGRCNKCGKYGHKAVACRSKPGDDKAKQGNKSGGFNSGKFTGECHYCKKVGHRASDCFKKKKDQGDNGQAKGHDMAEVVLMALDLDDFEMVDDDDSSSIDDLPALIPRDQQYFDSSDEESVPTLMERFYESSSSDDDSEEASDQAFAAMCDDDDDSENQIGHCTGCGGNGHIGMYCDACQDSGLIYETVPESGSEESNEDIVASVPEAAVSAPEPVVSAPETIPSAPDRATSAPVGVASRPYNTHNFEHMIYARPPENSEEDEMIDFLTQVCIELRMDSTKRTKWVLAVKAKFASMKLRTVNDVMKNIMKINRMLVNVYHRTPMKWETLDAMANVATHIMDQRVRFDQVTRDDYFRNRKEAQEKESDDIAMTMIEKPKSNYRFGKNTWLGDSAASTHMGNCDAGMFDVEIISSPIKIGDGKVLTATKIGKKRLTVMQADGKATDIVLEDYKYVPDLWVNLFSIPKSLGKGWNIGNQGVRLFLTKGKTTITFDREFPTQKGLVLGVEMVPRTVRNDTATPALDKGKIVNINKLHKVFGHIGEETLRKTAEFYGIKPSGKLLSCSDCGVSKSRQHNTSKTTESRSKIAGERLMIDTSSVKKQSFGKSKFWLLIMDDCTGVCWSRFLKKKSDQVELLINLLKDLKSKHDKTVKLIRCDNAGENKSLQKLCEQEGLGIQFEYTAPGTPQLNGRVERKFATLYGRVRAMLNGARLTKELRNGLWTEAARTASDLENTLTTTGKPVAAYNQFFEKEFAGIRNAHPFGEIGIVNHHKGKTLRGKLEDRGRACLHLGRAEDQPRDTYRFLNLDTRRVIHSRDVLWLDKSYGDWKGLSVNTTALDDDEEDDELLIDLDAPTLPPQDITNTVEVIPSNGPDETPTKTNPRLQGALRKIADHNTPAAAVPITTTPQTRSVTFTANQHGRDDAMSDDTASVLIDRFHHDFAMIATTEVEAEMMKDGDPKVSPSSYKDVYEAPSSYDAAWNHTDPWQRSKWRAAITLEYKKMEDHKVWEKVKRATMQPGKRCVKHKWINEIKRNGIFRSRLVACGYSQVPGIDFTNVYSPVVNDVTFRIMMVAEMVYKYKSKLIDIETAFLHGQLEDDEIVFMDCPHGMDHEDDECLRLRKTIYGLVQSARAFFKRFRDVLLEIGFEQSAADPCLMIRRNKLGVVYMALYVDDIYASGDEAALDDSIIGLRKYFKIKVVDDLRDYLSCEIIFSADKSKAWLGQPHLIKNLENKFGDLVKTSQKYRTPGTPGQGVLRPKEGDERITDEDQSLYRSGVGMLLYLVKHSRPDISNAVRELSKSMDGASLAAFKELKRVIKFVLDTKTMGLKMNPKMTTDISEWDIVVYTDSDWAGDKETRISVTGFIVFILGVPILWKSKGQRSVSLSSSEAEYFALSEASKDIKFVSQIMLTMGIPVRLPIVVRVDNVGAIFMSENVSASSRTKHIDIRYHFVREFVEDKFIKIIFVRTDENTSDGFTKNVTGDIYERHCKEFIAERRHYYQGDG
jgi:transposase InsO family protein